MTARTDPDDPLTARERETALLVAEGLTDRQIASRLCISERTVHAHLRSAYAKTGTGSRTRLLAWLARHEPGPGT
jgi:DNA-binding CsgD family transcriptional regulator